MRGRTWLLSVPRTRTWVKAPTAPVRLTATPGTSRRTSETMRIWRPSICCGVIRVTELAIWSASMPPGARVAVTTRSCTVVDEVGSSAAKAVRGAAATSADRLALRKYLGMEAPRLLASERQAESLLEGHEPDRP